MAKTTAQVNKIVGDNIKYLRGNTDLNQEDLAKKLGLSRISVVNIENGKQGLSMLTAIKMTKALNVPISEIIKGL